MTNRAPTQQRRAPSHLGREQAAKDALGGALPPRAVHDRHVTPTGGGTLREPRQERAAARAIHVRRNYAHSEHKLPKSGKVRSLPMSDQVAVALDGLSQREHFTEAGDLVFANVYGRRLSDKETRRAFYGAMKRAGLGHLREGPVPFVFHDLRHTFGTLCATGGVPVGEIQVYMGHASLSTTEIYMHHAPKHDAAQRLSEAFGVAADPVAGAVSVPS